MILTEKTNICDLLQEVPTLAGVLKRLGVADTLILECVSLGQLAARSGIGMANLVKHYELLSSGSTYNQHNFAALSMPDMVQLLRREHHEFLTKRLPRLSFILNELAARKGTMEPDLLQLQSTFEAFRADISDHILQEQDSLYPYAEALDAFLAGELSEGDMRHWLEQPSPVDHALRDDEDLNFFDQARYLTNHYTPSVEAGIMQRSLYKELAQFEKDLLRHEALEFAVLLNRVIELENGVWKRLQQD